MDTKTTESRFWARVKKGKSCWEWQGKPNKAGYGRFYVDGRLEYAHRYAYLLLIGDIWPGQSLYNTCSSRLCVNPAHWQTEKPIHITQNVIKRKNAPRRYSKRREKVTPAEVQAIISISENTNLTQTAIAARYRISQAQVSRILAGLSR